MVFLDDRLLLAGRWKFISEFPKWHFPPDPNQFYIRCCLVPLEGRFAIVTDVGTGCGGRGCAFDEQRMPRTAKSCGPDASTLAFKSRGNIREVTVTTKPDHRGEHEGNR